MRSLEWLDDANCKGADPEMFYSDDGHNYFEGHALCGTCPVKDDCLADVMATEHPSRRYGLRGGTTPKQRDELHRIALRVERQAS